MPVPKNKNCIKSEIPRVVHYCWFGRKPISEIGEKDISSWKEYLPNYQIVCHNDSNFDLTSCQFAVDAAKAEKWAFVSDYARFRLLFDYGGVYFDVGTELIKNAEKLFSQSIAAIEKSTLTIASGLVLATYPRNPLIKEVLEQYEMLEFRDDPDYLRQHTVNEILTRVFERHGFKRIDEGQSINGWRILPSHCFNPILGFGGYHISEDTYALHHSNASWAEEKFQHKAKVQRRLAPFVGRRIAQIIGRIYGEVKTEGFSKAIANIVTLTFDKVGKTNTGSK